MGDGDGDGVIPYETFSVGNLKDGNNEIKYMKSLIGLIKI